MAPPVVGYQVPSKGQQVYVEGRLRTRTYETRDDTTGFGLTANINDIHFLSSKRDGSATHYREEDEIIELPF
jgi:single-stranded DNA-binding protein